jgi:predicted dehydrogenase
VYAEPQVDIVHIGTPHAFHKDACLKAISLGKHVLCQKPLALNSLEANEDFDAAARRRRFVMEGKQLTLAHSAKLTKFNNSAVWTRFTPLVQQLLKLVHEERAIGDVHRIFCDVGLRLDLDSLPETSRLKNIALGAGSLLDIGIYSITWGLLLLDENIADAARKPELLSAQAIRTDIDVATSIILNYPEVGRQGILTSSVQAGTASQFARVEVSKGTIIIEGTAASLPLKFTITPADPAGETKVFGYSTGVFNPAKTGAGFFHEADALHSNGTAMDIGLDCSCLNTRYRLAVVHSTSSTMAFLSRHSPIAFV